MNSPFLKEPKNAKSQGAQAFWMVDFVCLFSKILLHLLSKK